MPAFRTAQVQFNVPLVAHAFIWTAYYKGYRAQKQRPHDTTYHQMSEQVFIQA